MKVLVTAPDIRVRRALSGLLQSAGYRTVVTAHPADLGPTGDPQAVPDLVVLHLGGGSDARDLGGVERLARLGCSVITVSRGRTRPTAVLAASAHLDEEDPRFADQLTDAVRRVAEERRRTPRRGGGRPGLRGTTGLRQRAPSDAVIPPMGRPGVQPQTASQRDPAPDVPGDARQGP